ncbi:MAG: hypothetical protein CMK36_00575 [Porticoccaceae bacterium]|nr:hypothetical protein [Porticoccaceae bacterium]
MPKFMFERYTAVFMHSLANLSTILSKAEIHVDDLGIDQSIFIGARLYPNMRPLSFQVQTACDLSKRGAARLALVDAPEDPDSERTFCELQSRIQRTISFLQSLRKTIIAPDENMEISFSAGPYDLKFDEQNFVYFWVLPNLHFHVTTAYNILRHNGVELKKPDFLGALKGL